MTTPPGIRDGCFGVVTSSGEPLTEAEVHELPEGTIIEVVWSGGNGPHRYRVHHERGFVYAAQLDRNPRFETYNPLTFVGRERFHTRVWLPQVSET